MAIINTVYPAIELNSGTSAFDFGPPFPPVPSARTATSPSTSFSLRYKTNEATSPTGISLQVPSIPQRVIAQVMMTGPRVLENSPPSIYQLIPLPVFLPENRFITTGEGTWNREELIPITR